jgi:hypothetical protein
MRIQVDGPEGIILEVETSSANVRLPMDKGERALAFEALVDALALLSGVTRPHSSGAKEGVQDRYCSTSRQDRGDHTFRAVEHQAAQREHEASWTIHHCTTSSRL